MSDGDIELYLREISGFPLLTGEEEQTLAPKILAGDAEARETMIRSNLRLVVSIAKKYNRRGMPLLDVIAEGNIGLLKAVERFRAGEGTRFSTYASWWIKQTIRRALTAKVKNIRIPAYMVELVSHWRRVSNELRQELTRSATDLEIAEKMQIPPEKIKVIRKALGAANSSGYSGMRTAEDGELLSIEDTLVRPGDTSPARHLFTDNEEEKLEVLLSCLDPREGKIIRFRYGIGTTKVLTLEAIGNKLRPHITRERVRQIETQALKTMLKLFKVER